MNCHSVAALHYGQERFVVQRFHLEQTPGDFSIPQRQ